MNSRPYLKQIDRRIPQPNIADYKNAVFILHDQLNLQAWPDWISRDKPLLIFIESRHEERLLPFHKKKLVFGLSSMRHFALQKSEAGFPVLYLETSQRYQKELNELLGAQPGLNLTYMCPSELESRRQLRSVKEANSDRVSELGNGFFFTDPERWVDKIGPGYRMEFFYRDMRRETGYLMDGDQPVGGAWNYDEQNRKKLPRNYPVPSLPAHEPDEVTTEVIQLVEEYYAENFGTTRDFGYAVTRDQALSQLDDFVAHRLHDFGTYQDALVDGEPFLFHSNVSLYLNNGLLMPREVCDRATEAYHNGKAPLNSVEGFLRQILGWREFVRIYYEALMPGVREANELGLREKLPDLYWTGDTKMACMRDSVNSVIEHGHSHHIQRLMVLSNFSNLTGTDPRELLKWFWFAYVDAYEWVVLPNVLGMSTFADGGILASKPYVSSGNYINKMSDYCKKCPYSISKKTGEKACPFNYLYWNFVDEQREVFNESGRVNFMVNMFDKKSEEEKEQIRSSTQQFLDQLKRRDYQDNTNKHN